MNYRLCFSTMHSLINWLSSDPKLPHDELLACLVELRNHLDLKISALQTRLHSEMKDGHDGPIKEGKDDEAR